MLDKKGNSNTLERCELWNRLAAMRLKDGDLLIVATSHDPDTAFVKKRIFFRV